MIDMIQDKTFKDPCCDYMAYMDRNSEKVDIDYNGIRRHVRMKDGLRYSNKYEYCPFCLHRLSYNPQEIGDAYVEMDCSDDCKMLQGAVNVFVETLIERGREDVSFYVQTSEIRVKGINLDEYKEMMFMLGGLVDDMETYNRSNPEHQGTPNVDGIACWNPREGDNMATKAP